MRRLGQHTGGGEEDAVKEIWVIEWAEAPGDIAWDFLYSSKEEAQGRIDSGDWGRFSGKLRAVCYQRAGA